MMRIDFAGLPPSLRRVALRELISARYMSSVEARRHFHIASPVGQVYALALPREYGWSLALRSERVRPLTVLSHYGPEIAAPRSGNILTHIDVEHDNWRVAIALVTATSLEWAEALTAVARGQTRLAQLDTFMVSVAATRRPVCDAQGVEYTEPGIRLAPRDAMPVLPADLFALDQER